MTGYFGRMGLFELMTVNESIQSLVQRRSNASEIRRSALGSGMESLKDDGISKASRGLTTLEEVLRVSMNVNEEPLGTATY